MNWREQAACLTQDPELFFPVGTSSAAIRQVQAAKRLCGQCVVRDTCLEWATSAGVDYGVWGGLSEDERRSRKRRLARSRIGATSMSRSQSQSG